MWEKINPKIWEKICRGGFTYQFSHPQITLIKPPQTRIACVLGRVFIIDRWLSKIWVQPLAFCFFETADKRRQTQMGINADILVIKEKKPDRGRFCRGSFTDIIDNHRQIRKTRPKAVPNRDYWWGGGGF